MVLLRFAPSPTGPLHLGGLRTALFNHLYARKLRGKWLLRIEDTDATRHVPGSVDGIRRALDWAGLEYDYGPGKAGPHAPYHQSERLDLYHFYAQKLLSSGHAYRCFCTPDQLSATRERLARTGSNNTYDKACLRLSDDEVARHVKSGSRSIVRLNDSVLPLREEPTEDLVFGRLRDAHASLPTDPVLLKSDGFPTYHLASVVDDCEMRVTHVLRGEEWLPSLPLHLDLYAALKLPAPKFAHLPLLLNADGTKMSKRNGDVQVQDYMRAGWEPAAVLNWLALAGWGVQHDPASTSGSTPSTPQTVHESSQSHNGRHAPDSTTMLTLPELIEQFDLSALTHRRTSLDPAKLAFLNKQHLSRFAAAPGGVEELARRAQVLVNEKFPESQWTSIEYLTRVIDTLQGGRLVNISDIPHLVPYLFTEPAYNTEEARAMVENIPPSAYHSSVQAVSQRLSGDSWDAMEFGGILREESVKLASHKPKVVMTALRHALSGTRAGPSIPEILRLLGRERTLARLQRPQAILGLNNGEKC